MTTGTPIPELVARINDLRDQLAICLAEADRLKVVVPPAPCCGNDHLVVTIFDQEPIVCHNFYFTLEDGWQERFLTW